MSIFTTKEYKDRLLKTKRSMADKGIDVLLVSDPANMNYLSGYDAWAFYVHQLLIVTLDEDEPIWIGRIIDETAAQFTTYLEHKTIIPYPDDHVHSTTKHPMDVVATVLEERNLDNKVIAAEFDAYYFTAKNYLQLTKLLPNARFVDGTNIVNWIRIIKSDQKNQLIKKATKIASAAMKKGIERIKTGVRQCDAVADIVHRQISGVENFGGDYTSIVPLLPTGERTNACHLTWTDEPFKKGPVIIELAGCYERYHSPLARTLVIGEPTKEMEALAFAAVEGINKALEMIKPGVTCEEIEATWRMSIQKRGFEKESRIGYSTGLNYPPDWGEHTASLRPGDQTILQPNMVFHMIPGIWLNSYGVEISETFIVTENGCEVLSDVERKLFIK